MKIVAFGDSITYGDTGDHKQPHPRRWTTLLAEKTGHEVVNKGVNGDTTRLALERFPKDVQESGADVVLIQFGYNDCNHWDTDHGLPRVSLGAFRENLHEMCDRARRFNIHPFVIPLHYSSRIGYRNWQEDYATVAQQFARENPNLWATGGLEPFRLELPDGLHLSPADNETYADWIASWFDTEAARRPLTPKALSR